jgi:hypothetical protein
MIPMAGVRIAAATAATGFVLLAGFQILLVLGVARGRAAWGGASEVLSPALRIASAGAAFVLVMAALVVLGRAGYWGGDASAGVFRWGTWILAGAMAVGALINFASPSGWERAVTARLALALAFMCLVVGVGNNKTRSQ